MVIIVRCCIHHVQNHPTHHHPTTVHLSQSVEVRFLNTFKTFHYFYGVKYLYIIYHHHIFFIFSPCFFVECVVPECLKFIKCAYGVAKDSNGCYTCNCNPPPIPIEPCTVSLFNKFIFHSLHPLKPGLSKIINSILIS